MSIGTAEWETAGTITAATIIGGLAAAGASSFVRSQQKHEIRNGVIGGLLSGGLTFYKMYRANQDAPSPPIPPMVTP